MAGGVPRNVYRAADGAWLVLSGTTDAQVARVLGVIGHDTPEARARFGRSEARLAAADALDSLVAEWIGRHVRDQVLAVFEAARVPVAPVNDLAAIAADPHVQARRSLVAMDGGPGGPILVPGPPVHLTATPGGPRSVGPPLGQHTAEVLAEWLDGAR